MRYGIGIIASLALGIGHLFATEVDLSDFVKRIGVQDPAQVKFEIVEGLDGFAVEAQPSGQLIVKAGKRVNLAPAYGRYLRESLGYHWSWNGNRMAPSPAGTGAVTQTSPEAWQVRWAYNYCTLSYTAAFWGQQEWSDELDRMALNGVTHVLVQAGLERVWQRFLKDEGYSAERIQRFIPAPSAAAWWNMGNLQGLGGPLTEAQIAAEEAIGQFIVARCKILGITPVLQAFTGLMPSDYNEVNSTVKLYQQGTWCRDFTRPAMLDPTSPEFDRLAIAWYRQLEAVYGVRPTALAGDLFHEGGVTEGLEVTATIRHVQALMQQALPGSTWFIQAWGSNPTAATLAGVDPAHTLILKLNKDLAHGEEPHHNGGYQQVPWVWCELLNFGGNQGLYGSLKILSNLDRLQRAPGAQTLKGLGLLSEGTETNPLFYDAFFDRFWINPKTHLTADEESAWIARYALRRYGVTSPMAVAALRTVNGSAYRPLREQEGCVESIFCARPGLAVTRASTWSSGEPYYDVQAMVKALKEMLAAVATCPTLLASETFTYDLADIARQALADQARPLLAQMKQAYETGDVKAFETLSAQFLTLIQLTEKVLEPHPLWRFDRMLAMAAKKDMVEQAKLLVTRWSPEVGGLNDYAHRQLAGLMVPFYYNRWKIYTEQLTTALKTGEREGALQRASQAVEAFEAKWLATPITSITPPAQVDGKALIEAAKTVYTVVNQK